MGEAHPEDAVAVVEDREVRGHVRLRARMRLDVDVLGAREERERPLLGERLDDVDELAAAVVAPAGLALGVLVRQPRALRLEHRRRDVVLARDQLDLPRLPVALAEHGRPDGSGSTWASRSAAGASLRLLAVDGDGHLGSKGVWCANASVPVSPRRRPGSSGRIAGAVQTVRSSRPAATSCRIDGSIAPLAEDRQLPSGSTATTVDGVPDPGTGPAVHDERDRRAELVPQRPSRVRASGSPERFADVTAIGPSARASAAGDGVVGQADAEAARSRRSGRPAGGRRRAGRGRA